MPGYDPPGGGPANPTETALFQKLRRWSLAMTGTNTIKAHPEAAPPAGAYTSLNLIVANRRMGPACEIFTEVPPMGSGYLINNSGGYPVGATELAVDTGAGLIKAGDVVKVGTDRTPHAVLIAGGPDGLSGPGILTIAVPGLARPAPDDTPVAVQSRIKQANTEDWEWTWSVNVYAADAYDRARRLVASTEIGSVRVDHFKPLEVRRVSAINRLPEFVEMGWEDRAQFDLTLSGIVLDEFLVDVIEQGRIILTPAERPPGSPPGDQSGEYFKP